MALLLTLMLAVTGCQKKPGESKEVVPSDPTQVASDSTEVPDRSKEVPLPKFSMLFSPDQQDASQVQAWGKSWISTSDPISALLNEPHKRYYELDLAKLVAQELLPPNGGEILDIATGKQNQQLALVRESSAITLFARSGEVWRPIKIPKELRASKAPFYDFLSEGDQLLILTEEMLWYRLDGTWQHLPLTTEAAPYAKPNSGTSVALMGSKLYLGFARGEWGGGVAILDLKSRTWSKAPTLDEMELSAPVEGFNRGPSGTLWVLEAMAHMGTYDYSIRVLKQEGWEDFAKFVSYHDYQTQQVVVTERKNWDEPAMAFMDLAFDARGRVHLLTNRLGILRYEQGKWLRLTKKWFDFSHPETKYRSGSPPGELVLADDHTALLASGDFGVLLWDLVSNEVTRIPIKKQEP